MQLGLSSKDKTSYLNKELFIWKSRYVQHFTDKYVIILVSYTYKWA
jgi:hypothetical protein